MLFAQISEEENAKSIFSEFLNTNRSNYTNIFLLSIFFRMFVRDYCSLLIAHRNYSLDSYNSCSIKILIKILNYYSCYKLQARVHINYPYLSKTSDLRGTTFALRPIGSIPKVRKPASLMEAPQCQSSLSMISHLSCCAVCHLCMRSGLVGY